jgi:hypothetical protein
MEGWPKGQSPLGGGLCAGKGCLTMTYFRMGNPHYHRRAAVSRSCSGWEGVGPAGYGRQALRVGGQGVTIGWIAAAGLVGEEVKDWVRCTQTRLRFLVERAALWDQAVRAISIG